MRLRSLAPLGLAGVLLSLALAPGVHGQSTVGTPSGFAVLMHHPETFGVDEVGFYAEFPVSTLDGRTQVGIIRSYPGAMQWSYRFNDGGFVTVTDTEMSKDAVIPRNDVLFPGAKRTVVMRYARGTIVDASADLAGFIGGFTDMRVLGGYDPDFLECICRFVAPDPG
jgi:hypothetical protein